MDEGEPNPEFEAILDTVDPNRDGHVSLQEYMAFMISRETENVTVSMGQESGHHLAVSPKAAVKLSVRSVIASES